MFLSWMLKMSVLLHLVHPQLVLQRRKTLLHFDFLLQLIVAQFDALISLQVHRDVACFRLSLDRLVPRPQLVNLKLFKMLERWHLRPEPGRSLRRHRWIGHTVNYGQFGWLFVLLSWHHVRVRWRYFGREPFQWLFLFCLENTPLGRKLWFLLKIGWFCLVCSVKAITECGTRRDLLWTLHLLVLFLLLLGWLHFLFYLLDVLRSQTLSVLLLSDAREKNQQRYVLPQ